MRELQLCWKSVRPERNRYRYYSLTVDRDLWGRLCLVRRWGRIWSGNREKYAWPETETEIERLVREIHLNRLRHGYRLIRGQQGTPLSQLSAPG